MQFRRWRGVKSLVHNAVERTVDLIEEGHESTARGVVGGLSMIPGLRVPARMANRLRRISTATALGTVRVVNRIVEESTDVGLDVVQDIVTREVAPHSERPVPMRSDTTFTPSNMAIAAIGLMNGIVGDTLHANRNALSLTMQLRLGDRYLPSDPAALKNSITNVTPKIAVFVHGLATTEWSWCLNASEYHGSPDVNFGTLLARDLGFTPVWVRYNTGRHVSENGRELNEQLEVLMASWPVEPSEVVLIGHSMGGLVVRSACHYAQESASKWIERVRRIFCLGSPHRGAALEKFGHLATAVLGAIDTPGTRIPALILQGRSAGIKDMRHGSLVDDDWIGRDLDALTSASARAVPLLEGVEYHFMSASITNNPEHPLGQLIGDVFVHAWSASGPTQTENAFRIETRHYGGVMHHQLQNHPDVYAQIRTALAR
jgi:pimeloyl-ACP methyl ester carboxylesterase